jgi:hypothetical protein
MRLDMGGVDHLHVRGSSIPGKLTEQTFPDAAPRPARKAIIDRGVRTVRLRTIFPSATTLKNVHDAADDAPVIYAINSTHIRGEKWFDPLPLLVAQPKQIPAHLSSRNTNQYRIVTPQKINEF